MVASGVGALSFYALDRDRTHGPETVYRRRRAVI